MVVLTQTLVKDLENPDTCPRRWYGQWVTKEFSVEPTEVQNYGRYFEYLCIGATADETVPVLPTTSRGEKTAVAKRIEQQADVFRSLWDPSSPHYVGHKIVRVQELLVGNINGVPVQGRPDIIAEDENGGPYIWDLKCTEDCFADTHPAHWGNEFKKLDLLQLAVYQELYTQVYGVKPGVGLMIFDYGTKLNARIIKVNLTPQRVVDMQERFEAAAEVVQAYNQRGWSRIPSRYECKRCGVANCELRYVENKLHFESYTV